MLICIPRVLPSQDTPVYLTHFRSHFEFSLIFEVFFIEAYTCLNARHRSNALEPFSHGNAHDISRREPRFPSVLLLLPINLDADQHVLAFVIAVIAEWLSKERFFQIVYTFQAINICKQNTGKYMRFDALERSLTSDNRFSQPFNPLIN